VESFESRKKRWVDVQDLMPVFLNYLTSQKPEIACKQKKVRIILSEHVQDFPVIFISVPPSGVEKDSTNSVCFCTFERISIGFIGNNHINCRVFYVALFNAIYDRLEI
jgi:hypothetical protein